MVGSFDKNTPYIDIQISGWNQVAPVTLRAVVDTGFTGFLQLPILTAFPVGLILHSTMDITLADGAVHTKLVCFGTLHFEGNTRGGLILIEEQGTDILVGTEFLRAFDLVLTLDVAAETLELRAK